MQTRLPFFGLVRASGDDAAAFLHNQLSNDIQNLAAGQACYATYNTPKGRVIANMLVLNRGDDLLLALSADLIEPLVKRLRMFVLRAKVVFEPLADFAVAAELPDNIAAAPAAAPALAFAATEHGQVWQIALPHQGRLNIGPAADLPDYDAAAENAWARHEIESGYPWICAATSETAVAQMLNQHIIGGVHFKKGCYPGQEIIARAQYRGQVKRGLVMYGSNQLVEPGEKLYDDADEEVGVVINAIPQAMGSLILAVVKHSVESERLNTEKAAALDFKRRFYLLAEDAA